MQHHVCYLLSIIFSVFSTAAADNIIYVQCTQLNFTSNTPYELNLKSLFTSIVESASVRNFNTFKISPPGKSQYDVVYGLFQCRGDLSLPDCRDCVANALSPLNTACPVSIGGVIQLEGCLVKYDNTSFFGFEDKTEVLKTCGTSIDYNSDALQSRDDAFAYLNSLSGKYFRVGGSGTVQGVAQCIEDLTITDCEDCLAEASEKLRSECKTSSSGDMYLGKCNFRYANRGIDHGTSYTDDHNDDTNENHSGEENYNNILKAIGIIVAAILGSSSLSYCFSVTITKNLFKIYANNTNENRNTITIQGEVEEGKKKVKDLVKKESLKIEKKANYVIDEIEQKSRSSRRYEESAFDDESSETD